jgi:hypothetical protein
MYICKYCGREFENRFKLNGHVCWCKSNPNANGKCNFNSKTGKKKMSLFNESRDDLFCQHCGKQCKNLNSLTQHEVRCKQNPNAILVKDNLYKYRLQHQSNTLTFIPWNKGLTKDTDDRVKKYGETHHNRHVKGEIKTWCDGLTKETDERIKKYAFKISETIASKIEDGDWHCQNRKRIEYKGEIFDSEWEYEFAKFLDLHKIKWNRRIPPFIYIYENSEHRYFPDLYLPEHDLYIEIKGRCTDKDKAKWDQFDKKLDIYFLKDLKQLDIEYFKNIVDNRFDDELNKYSHKYLDLTNL